MLSSFHVSELLDDGGPDDLTCSSLTIFSTCLCKGKNFDSHVIRFVELMDGWLASREPVSKKAHRENHNQRNHIKRIEKNKNIK